jgi:hypothetical protein
LHEPGNLHRSRDFVEQRNGSDLVRHRHQRAADVAQAKQRFQERRVILGLHAHRHDDGVDSRFVEIGVVDQGGLEGFGRKSEVRNQRGLAAYHFDPPVAFAMEPGAQAKPAFPRRYSLAPSVVSPNESQVG